MEHCLRTQVAFEAAHRLYDVDTYSEECRNNIHGHSYKVTVYARRSRLNSANMVIDFKLLKEIIRKTIEDTYDHSCILRDSDPLAKPIADNCKKVHIVSENPTAEWMAEQFFYILNSAIRCNVDPDVTIIQVDVQETENNVAIYRGDV